MLLTGIGGQGVQLAARVLAEAAVAEGREAMIFASYGGMMRGGRTDSAVVVAEGAVEAPPVFPAAWGAYVMHPEFAASTWSKLRPDGVAVVNTTVVTSWPAGTATVVEVPAGDLAVDAGNLLVAGMVLLGALAATTGIVAVASLQDAVAAAIPAYRRHHVEANQAALALGAGAVAPGLVPAWPCAEVGRP